MQLSVLIEPVANNGFRARGGEPFAVCAEGATRDEALQKLRELVQARLAQGAEVVTLDVPATDHPWGPYAGMFQDEPLLDEWKQAMADHRRQANEAAEQP